MLKLKIAWNDGRLPTPAYYLVWLLAFSCVAHDIFCNLSIISIIMIEFPKEWKVADRVSRHINDDWGGAVYVP
jgi:hypothetical protein